MYRIVRYDGNNTGVLRLEDNTFIPAYESNTAYQAYLKWLEEGNEVLPADEPPADEPPAVEPLPAVEPPADEPPVDEVVE